MLQWSRVLFPIQCKYNECFRVVQPDQVRPAVSYEGDMLFGWIIGESVSFGGVRACRDIGG